MPKSTAARPRKTKETLPTWNLSDLYAGPKDAGLEADVAWCKERSDAFQIRYKGKLAGLSGAEMGAAIAEFERIVERRYKLGSYSQLLHAANVSDPAVGQFYQTLTERMTDIGTATLFFTLELNRLDDAVVEKQLADPAAGKYASWVKEVRLYRPHQLSDELEQFIHDRAPVDGSWSRLFDETLAGMRFPIGGKKLTLSDVMNRMSDKSRAKRKAAAKALGKGLNERIGLFSLITNTLAKEKELDDRWRKYAGPVSYRNLSNRVEDEVVEALSNSVRGAYPELSHRYYKLKAKWLGVKKLDYWDRNAPLPKAPEREYTWKDARKTVLNAYGAFAPEMADVADRFFEGRWIDAPPRAGKSSGAFSHSTVPSVHPYILMNFHGKARDVMTLAHELGHGVHQVLAGPQGVLMADTPLTLAETASVFGEMLTFQAMLKAEDRPAMRRALLAGKVEDMLNTVVRQIAFFEFEKRVHTERRQGELSQSRIGDIWMDVQKESLGPALRFDDDYRPFWAYIPHFIHSPFYVYAYAFGDCLVNSLYAVFQNGHPGFQAKYLKMLQAGGTLRHKELLAPFGLDAGDPGFWKKGLSVVAGFIDELERMR